MKNKNLTVKEFTKNYLNGLQTKFPDTKFTTLNDSTLNAEHGDNIISMSVDNAYIEYQSNPGSLQQILTKYISATSEVFNPKKQVDIESIVPVIKPVEFQNEANDQLERVHTNKKFEGVYEKYNDQLIIIYAEDSKTNIKYLTQDDLKSISIQLDSLRVVAVRNLNKLLTSIQKKGSNGTYMLMAGGDYEASLILLDDILTKENFPVKGDLVIAIPNRDMLLVTGSNDKAGVEKIRNITTESFQKGTYPVSEFLYKWNGHMFEKFD